jgi:hypothetical protein
MGTPSKQIGWSTESNLLHSILRQLDQLAGVIAVSGGGGLGNFVTLDTVQPIVARKDFSVVAGPAATFTSSTGNTVNVTATTGSGVYSTSVDGPGIEGFSVNDPGIFGYSTNDPGVFAHSQNSVAIIIDSLNLANLSNLANFRRNNVVVASIDYQGGIVANTTKTAGFTVATLPSPPLTGVGTRAYVTNALAPAFGSAVVGGGAVVIPVFYNGVTWIVG